MGFNRLNGRRGRLHRMNLELTTLEQERRAAHARGRRLLLAAVAV